MKTSVSTQKTTSSNEKVFFNSLSPRQFVLKLILFLVVMLSAVGVRAQMDLSIIWQKQAGERINFAKFSADGNYIYCALDNQIIKMDAKTGEHISILKDPTYIAISDMEISKDGNTIMTLFTSKGVNLWDTKSEKVIKYIIYEKPSGMDGVLAADLSPNGDYYIAYVTEYIEMNNTSKAWLIKYDIKSNTEVKRVVIDQGTTRKIAISNDDRRFVTGSYYQDNFSQKFYNQLILWDTETLVPLDTLQNLEITSGNYGYRLIKFSPDDKYLGCIRESMDGPDIFNLQTKEMVRTSDGRACASLIFLPDSIYYIAVLAKTGFCVYDLKEHKPIKYYNTETYGGGFLEVSNLVNGEYCIFSIGAGGNDGIALIKGSITNVNENTRKLTDFLLNYESGFIKFSLNTSVSEKAIISIYDFLGNLKYQESILIEPSKPIIINFKESSGIYFCKLLTSNNEYTKKFEVVR